MNDEEIPVWGYVIIVIFIIVFFWWLFCTPSGRLYHYCAMVY